MLAEMVRLSYQHKAFYCYVILSVWIFLLVAGNDSLLPLILCIAARKGRSGSVRDVKIIRIIIVILAAILLPADVLLNINLDY